MKESCFGLKYFALKLKFPRTQNILRFAAQPQPICCYVDYGMPLVALTWLNLWYFLSNTRIINVTPPIAITVHLDTVFNWSRVSYTNIKHECYYLSFLRIISYWSDPLRISNMISNWTAGESHSEFDWPQPRS